MSASGQQATQTLLSVSAGGAAAITVPAKTVVTLTATVAAGAFPVAGGQVVFCDAAYPHCTDIHILGTSQIISAGTATFKFVPGPGTHSYKAMFSGTNANASSTSANVMLTVLAATGPITTTVGIQASGQQGDYALLGTVASNGPASPTGSISFLDTTNANYMLGTAMLGPTGSNGISFLNTTTFSLPNPDLNGGGVVAAGDFNGDGIPDLLVSNTPNYTIYLFLGKGDGTFSVISMLYPTKVFITGITAGDFNRDGKLDYAVNTDAGMAVYLGNGDGTFRAGQVVNLPQYSGGGSGGLVTADFNGDGILDLAQAYLVGAPGLSGGNCDYGYQNCYVQIFLGNGDGTFTALASATPANFANGLVTADFNGDGKPDLAASSGDGYVLVLLGNGDGTFTSAPHSLINSYSVALATADLNGDGKADLVVETQLPQISAYVLLGKGDGTFTVLPADPNLAQQTEAVAIGDFNGDGIPDLIQPNDNGGYTSVFIGKGDGTFVPDAFSPTIADYSYVSIAIADFNGDGQSDIAESMAYSGSIAGFIPGQLNVLLAQSPSTAATYLYNVSPVGTGYHYVDASYTGDRNNQPGVSSTIPLLAEQVTTALALTANPSSSYPGLAVTLTATLGPFLAQNHYASGNVTFTSNGKSLGSAAVSNGVATLTTSALALGTDNLLAKYPGDTNFTASVSSSVPIVVSAATTLTLTSSLNPAPVLAPVTFTVHLAANGLPAPVGSAVSLSLNSQAIVLTTDANGNATYTTSSLPVGSDPVTASFGGSASLLASSAALTEVIQLVPTTTALTAAPNPAYLGQTVTLTATVGAGAQQALGNVTFLDGGTVLGSAPLANQSLNGSTIAVLTVSTLAVGTHPLTATYAAGAVLAGSSSGVVQEVVLPSSFTLALSPTSLTMRGGQTATVGIQLGSVGNFAGPVALSPGALPMYATATISPVSVTLMAGGTGASTLTIKTMQRAENVAPPRPGTGPGAGPGSRDGRWAAVMAAALLLWLPLGGRRRAWMRGTGLRVGVGLLWLGLLVQGLTGCTNAYYTDLVVAPGSYPVTVTGTDQNGGQQAATLTVVITP